MGDIGELYFKGLSLSGMLDIIDKQLGNIIDGEKISDAISRYQHEIDDELRLCAHYRTTAQVQEQSEKIIEGNRDLISKLEDRLLNALHDHMKKRHYALLGHTSIDSYSPVIIPIENWDHVQIYKGQGDWAFYGYKQYFGIKFVSLEQLKRYQATNDEEELTLESNTHTTIKPNIKKISSSNKLNAARKQADSKLTKKREDNLTKAIKDAIFRMGKKPSLEELWNYFLNDKDETGNIEDYTDIHLTWKDTKGILHDTKKASLANRLSRINR